MTPKSKNWNHALGAAAEDHVAAHLGRRGLRILATRYRRSGGELDLVAEDGGTIVIVEVKARASASWGDGLEAVGWRKRRRIVRAARAFLSDHGLQRRPVRFDVVAVRSRRGKLRVDWVRDAFRP